MVVVGSVFVQSTDPSQLEAIIVQASSTSGVTAAPQSTAGQSDWVEIAANVPVFVERVDDVPDGSARCGFRVEDAKEAHRRLVDWNHPAVETISDVFDVAGDARGFTVKTTISAELFFHE